MLDLKSINGVFTDIREAITGEKIKDPIKRLEVIQKINEVESDIIRSKAEIIKNEAKSEHILTSIWRPVTMLVFVFIVANNYILVPYLQAFGLKIPILTLEPQMWDLLKIGIGGYVIGRSIEKTAEKMKK